MNAGPDGVPRQKTVICGSNRRRVQRRLSRKRIGPFQVLRRRRLRLVMWVLTRQQVLRQVRHRNMRFLLGARYGPEDRHVACVCVLRRARVVAGVRELAHSRQLGVSAVSMRSISGTSEHHDLLWIVDRGRAPRMSVPDVFVKLESE